MPLVLDLHITHERFGSISDLSINGHLHCPRLRSPNETVTDKIRRYHSDYKNRPSNGISFMSVIPSTSGRLHSEFVCLLFLQTYRENDLFFVASGVHLHNLPVVTSTTERITYRLYYEDWGLVDNTTSRFPPWVESTVRCVVSIGKMITPSSYQGDFKMIDKNLILFKA